VYWVFADVTDMLFFSHSTAERALQADCIHEPGAVWYYSSGTTNILSHVLRASFKGDGGDEAYLRFPNEWLFHPLGIFSAVMEIDNSGTFIASSYSRMTALDWNTLGQLYLQDGVVDGKRILPEGWVAFTRTPAPASKGVYGAQFWLRPDDLTVSTISRVQARLFSKVPQGTYYMSGFEDQSNIIIDKHQLVVTRLGVTAREGDYDAGGVVEAIIANL
jgi:CubicO group peptidase (beta-lactamase class C family)